MTAHTKKHPKNKSAELVSIKHLFKQYESDAGIITPVLKDINISIYEGEFVAIMGPSGSGKSTFMNILGCLDIQTAGDYHLSGENVSGLSSDQTAEMRNYVIGFIFQGFNLLPRRSAIHNVAMPLICAGKDRQESEERARDLLGKVGLSQRVNSLPNELSGGQQQRVAIARSLANHPKLILADEPTGNLDSTTSQEIMQMMVELNEKHGITIVLVTHEADIAEFAKRLIKFKDGIVVYDGPVNEKGLNA
jgi:putative ABC transport system ATP-binding protein